MRKKFLAESVFFNNTVIEIFLDFPEWSSLFTIHVANMKYFQTYFQSFQSPRQYEKDTLYLRPNLGDKRIKYQ